MAMYTQFLIWFFVIALVLGALANKSNFCTMGAVSDWVNFGDLNRMRSWVLAMAVAILGVGLLEYSGIIDMSLTTNNNTSTPPYRISNFVWLRYLVGGLLFGIGMTLGSGCGNKTLVRIGEGNLKSLVVFLCISAAASLMLFTSFDYQVFLRWMMPLSINFAAYGASGQDLASLVFTLVGVEAGAVLRLLVALVIGGLLLFWVLKSAAFRAERLLLVTGAVVGALVLGAWYLTAGPQGQVLLEELAFMDQPPYATGAQSLTFIGPTAHAAQYVYQGFSLTYLSMGLASLVGVVVGSFLYTLMFRKIRIEWFSSWSDFMRHIIGGLLMGIGGVLAMGCTIGQGITGVSTLALGSFIALGSIIVGSKMTMKYQYYRILHEDSSVFDAMVTVLVDLHLLPGGLRRLEDL